MLGRPTADAQGSRSRAGCWTLILGLLALVGVVASRSTFTIAWSLWGMVAILSCTLLAVSRLYSLLRRREGRLSNTLHELALLSAYAPAAAALSYIVLTPSLPLVDSQLATIDRMLGFDWPAWYRLVSDSPRVEFALQVFYRSSLLHVIVLILALGLIGRIERARELNALLIATSLPMVLISGLLPALSAWVYYDIGVEKAYHLEHVVGLRDGSFRILSPGTLLGIVTFPSFHTAIALALVYASRGIAWLFYPTLLINVGVLVSIPSEGGHYLVDMLAGFLITVVAVGWLRARPAAPKGTSLFRTRRLESITASPIRPMS